MSIKMVLEARNIESEQLDELVHDHASRMASSVNNGGMSDQLCFLSERGVSDAEILEELGISHEDNPEDDIDLFEHPEKQPPELRCITEKFGADVDGDPYHICREFLEEVKAVGFTFEYGLDGIPFNLKSAGKD